MRVVIPSRYEPNRLLRLVESIYSECDGILILDNGHRHGLPALRDVTVIDARGDGIYRMWNRGRAWARPEKVAILNDDVEVEPGLLTAMSDALDDERVGIAYPGSQTVTDPLGPYQMTGYCFAFRSDIPVGPFDENFRWWCGDTAFERAVLRRGFSVVGVPGTIRHESDSERDGWARRPELRDYAIRDLRRWRRIIAWQL